MKGMLTTAEAAEAIGISVSTLWRWEQEQVRLRSCRIPMRSQRCWSTAMLKKAGYIIDEVDFSTAPDPAASERVLFLG